MSIIIIKPARRFPPIPRIICIDNQPLGIVKNAPAGIRLPAGTYKITVRSTLRFIESSVMVSVSEGVERTVTFADREKWWNVLFNLDLFFWLVTLFIHVAQPWSTVYDVLSYGFFVIWLVRLWIIRRHYYAISVR